MQANVGDRIVITGHRAGERDRDCEVEGRTGRWTTVRRAVGDSGHEALVFPGSDASVQHFEHAVRLRGYQPNRKPVGRQRGLTRPDTGHTDALDTHPDDWEQRARPGRRLSRNSSTFDHLASHPLAPEQIRADRHPVRPTHHGDTRCDQQGQGCSSATPRPNTCQWLVGSDLIEGPPRQNRWRRSGPP